MGRCSLLCWIAIALLASAAQGEEVTIGARTLRVAEGYEIELIAGPPLVERPIAVARDERGRLYVTDSAGMNDKADKQLLAKPHRIRRLEDTNDDGRYDRSTLFAEGMMFPEGCLWHGGSLYVAAPPQIWKLTDDDDDGRADRREIWFDGKTLTGCANDLHGPYPGPDGRFYWCKGAFAEQRFQLPNGKPFVTRCSHIFRARPNGAEIEPVLTGGMDNAVNVAFLTTGERILSCTFLQNPEAGRRDGLIHAIYGGVYGKQNAVIEAHPRTGDVMPVLSHQGPAAPCGLIAGSEQLFGGEHANQLFACYFNLHQVTRHSLEPDGPTFRCTDQEFVACNHPDFHPTDVYEDADGSLLVVDTGGWYKVCCPTSQLAKPDVLGAIYRVRKRGQPAVNDPLGSRLAWNDVSAEELVARLDDGRTVVQRRATALLREPGDDSVPALLAVLQSAQSPALRRRIVWTLAGIDGEPARAAVRRGLNDSDSTVQQAAIHVAGLARDRAALGSLKALLLDKNLAIARVAAEAIGRTGDPQAAPALLEAIHQLPASTPGEAGAPSEAPLRISEHSLIYALIEIADPQATAEGLHSASPQVRRAALVALDQMAGRHLSAEQVLPLLDHESLTLRRTAAWIVGQHAEWGVGLAKFYGNRLRQLPAVEAECTALAEQLGRGARAAEIQELLAQEVLRPSDPAALAVALRAMQQAGLPQPPESWFHAIAQLLPQAKPETVSQALAAARQWPLPKQGHAGLQAACVAVARRTELDALVRLEALAIGGSPPELDAELFAWLLASALESRPYAERTLAVQVLAAAKLQNEHRLRVAQTLKHIGPLEMSRVLSLFEQGANDALGKALVEGLCASPGLRGLRPSELKRVLAKYSREVQAVGQELIAALAADEAQQAVHLDELQTTLPPGDARRGHELFMSQKVACIGCHLLGYHGGRLGPDLTNIGKVRNERDLLEAIVYPGASLVRGYEPKIVTLHDGRIYTGIVARESPEEIVLAVEPQKSITLARSAIEDIQLGAVSFMPQGIEKTITPQDLADLVTFLRSSQR